MKKLLKAEMEFIRFGNEDIVTTSGGDTYKMATNEYTTTADAAKETKEYGGLGWNFTK